VAIDDAEDDLELYSPEGMPKNRDLGRLPPPFSFCIRLLFMIMVIMITVRAGVTRSDPRTIAAAAIEFVGRGTWADCERPDDARV
jgi:hypothetical protein